MSVSGRQGLVPNLTRLRYGRSVLRGALQSIARHLDQPAGPSVPTRVAISRNHRRGKGESWFCRCGRVFKVVYESGRALEIQCPLCGDERARG